MLNKLFILLFTLGLSTAQGAPYGAEIINNNKCINYLSDLECESESSMSAYYWFGGKATASCAFNIDIVDKESGEVTSHEYIRNSGRVFHENLFSGTICTITIGLGCLPFQLSAKIVAAGKASSAIEPLYDYYAELVESHVCDEKEFN